MTRQNDDRAGQVRTLDLPAGENPEIATAGRIGQHEPEILSVRPVVDHETDRLAIPEEVRGDGAMTRRSDPNSA